MRHPLRRHPSSPPTPGLVLEAEAERRGASLWLRYRLSGPVADLVIPEVADQGRTDGLWRHSCFEAFVRAREEYPYLEVNLSPSTGWATYRFDGYRASMRQARAEPWQILVTATGDHSGLELEAEIGMDPGDLRMDAAWKLGLSAVLEDREGGLSYWALAHPPGKPDFHSPDCFALELPAPERP